MTATPRGRASAFCEIFGTFEREVMGFIICALLWGVVVLEEVERIGVNDWNSKSRWQILLFRNTRNRVAFLLSFLIGLAFLFVEIRLILSGRFTFNPVQGMGMLAILVGAYIFAITKKG